MFSQRFGLEVQITRHARERMAQRSITEAMLSELLETGQVRHKDHARLWVAKAMEGGHDNLVCAAVVVED